MPPHVSIQEYADNRVFNTVTNHSASEGVRLGVSPGKDADRLLAQYASTGRTFPDSRSCFLGTRFACVRR